MGRIIHKFNAWWTKNTTVILRLRWLIIALVFVADVIGFVGMKRIRTDDSFDSWLMEGDPLLEAKDTFESIFGNPEYVCILIESDNVFEHDLLAKMRQLGDQIEREVPLVDEVTALSHVDFVHGTADGIHVGELIPDPIPEAPAELQELRRLAATKPHLVNRMFREDNGSAMLITRLLPYPDSCSESESRSKVTRSIYKLLEAPEFADLNITTSGMPVFNHEKSNFYSHESLRLVRMTLLVIGLMLIFILRSPVGLFAPLFTAISAVLMVFGIQGFMGLEIQAMVISLPILLLLVISVGYSIHIISFFQQQFRRCQDRQQAITFALEHAAWPLLFTVITTTGGFISFLFVPITAIRWIGYTAAMMTMVAYPLVVFLTPVLLSFGPNQPRSCRRTAAKRKKCPWSERMLLRLADVLECRPKAILLWSSVLCVLFLAGAANLRVDTDFKKMDGMRIPYMQRLFHCARDIGSLYSYDVTVMLPENDQAKDPQNLQKLDQMAAELNRYPTIKRTTSLTDIVKDLHQTLNEGNDEFYTIPDDQMVIAQLLLLYEMSGGSDQEDWVDYDYRNLRMQVELHDFNVGEAREQLAFARERAAELFPEADILVSGQTMNFVMMCTYLIRGQLLSIAGALVIIAITMMIVFGSVKLGLIAMIPNIAPVIAVAGVMGSTGIPLHLITVMIAPMILGIAVDDTIHYTSHFKQVFERTGSYRTANRETLQSVGKALFMTSFIIILGFSMFGTSLSNGYCHMAFLTGIAVITALLADYFITPTLIMLIKPWGPEK